MTTDTKGPIKWPNGKSFAFSVFDDTDRSTLSNVKEVYSFLADCGFRTTKSVWPIAGSRDPRIPGETCDNRDYADWVLQLARMGFEIGYHMATYHSSLRRESIKGIEAFRHLFGHYPRAMANHDVSRENMYWGRHRLSGFHSYFYTLLTLDREKNRYSGHVEGTPYFWGDICKERIKYVRNFTFKDVLTLKVCPFMPYHDATKPYVNFWFSSSDGSTVDQFNRLLCERNQDRLEKEGSACIVTTHFGKRFWENGGLDARFKVLMTRLSRKRGWFVPVSDLLDYLLAQRGPHSITRKERKRLERKWLLSQIMRRLTGVSGRG